MLPCQKAEFFLPEDEHYLNCAYMAPLSRTVEAAGVLGVRRKRVPSRLSPDDFFVESERVRTLFATLIGAPDPRRVVLVPAVSYAMATVAQNTAPRPGGNVVVTHEQFPSNVYAWRTLCDRTGMKVRTVEAPEVAEGRGEGWNQRVLEAIDADTVVVALGHVHWTDGTRFDLERIGARAREVGAALVVDGTQSVGALPFDVGRFQPDMLVCAAYKWLMGPYSLAVAYLGPRYDGGTPLEQTWLGRVGSEQFETLLNYRDEYQPAALRYEMGERSNFALLPMLIAALEQVVGWGAEEIQRYCAQITADALRDVRALGWSVEEEGWRGHHLVGLRAPAGVRVEAVHELLTQRRVLVTRRGSALRVAPHLYNDAADLAALAEAVRDGTRSAG